MESEYIKTSKKCLTVNCSLKGLLVFKVISRKYQKLNSFS